MRSPKPRARVRAPAENARPDSRVRNRRLECAPRSSSRRSSRVRTALKTLRRLRGGWRPPESLLADARPAGHWAMARQTGAAVYQLAFQPGSSSWTIAGLLALHPTERWGLLFGDRWIRLGEALGEMPPVDTAEIMALAEQWLLSRES